MFEPGSALMVNRAGQLAHELGIDFCIVSCGQEWRRPDLAKETDATFIVPLSFPSLPKVPTEADWEQVTLDQLRNCDWAPENAAVLREQGREIALTTYGLNDKKKFRQNLRLALDRGLSETDALAALTTVPARLCGVENLLGTIEPGKLATLTVVQGESYFQPKAEVRGVWIDGRSYLPVPEEPRAGEPEAKQSEKPAAGEEGRPKSSKEEPEKRAKPPELAEKESEKTATETTAAAEERPGKKDKKEEQERAL